MFTNQPGNWSLSSGNDAHKFSCLHCWSHSWRCIWISATPCSRQVDTLILTLTLLLECGLWNTVLTVLCKRNESKIWWILSIVLAKIWQNFVCTCEFALSQEKFHCHLGEILHPLKWNFVLLKFCWVKISIHKILPGEILTKENFAGNRSGL